MLSLEKTFGTMEMLREARKCTAWPSGAHPPLTPLRHRPDGRPAPPAPQGRPAPG